MNGLPSGQWTLRARWVVPVEGQPVRNGIVHIVGERFAGLEKGGKASVNVDVGDAVVFPGLANAHAHLDLCGLRGWQFAGCDFLQWLRAVIAYRKQRTPEETANDIESGVAESRRFGTTLIGDISAEGVSWRALGEAPLRAVVFRELIGLRRERARQSWSQTRQWFEAHRDIGDCRLGLSPHAPYSTRRSLFAAAFRWAEREGMPVSIHWAETNEESDLLHHHTGPFASFLQGLGAWDPNGLLRAPNELFRLWREGCRLLLIHGNYLQADVSLPDKATIVICPRTHARFHKGRHPIAGLLKQGHRLALGTDSLASAPDLDVLAEARFLHAHYPEIPPAQIIEMATAGGAQVLGYADQTGTLATGRSADLVVLPSDWPDHRDPCEAILESEARITGVLFKGRWLVREFGESRSA